MDALLSPVYGSLSERRAATLLIRISVVLIIPFILLLKGACVSFQQDEEKLVPNPIVRQHARAIKPDDVAFLRFYGLELYWMKDNPLDVDDPKLIAQFLAALRNAYGSPSDEIPKNRIHNLEIYWKPHGGKYRDPLKFFPFEAHRPVDCFGLEFWKLLGTPLGEFRAKQIRKIVLEKGPEVKSIEVGGDSGIVKLTQHADMDRVLKALSMLDARAFSYNKRSDCCLTFSLYIGPRTLDTIEIAFPVARAPWPGSDEKPPLPDDLWKYCSKQRNPP
jgi:hypothetical protein